MSPRLRSSPLLALFLPLSRKPLTRFVSTDFDFFRSLPLFGRSSWPLLDRCIYLAVCNESVWIRGSLVFPLSCFVTRIQQNFAQTPLSPQINNSLPSLFSPPLHSPSIWIKVSDGRCICFTNSNILVMKNIFFTPGGTWENALLWWPQPWTYQKNKPAHYRVWGKKHFFLWALSSVWRWHSEWTQRRNHAPNRSLQ